MEELMRETCECKRLMLAFIEADAAWKETLEDKIDYLQKRVETINKLVSICGQQCQETPVSFILVEKPHGSEALEIQPSHRLQRFVETSDDSEPGWTEILIRRSLTPIEVN